LNLGYTQPVLKSEPIHLVVKKISISLFLFLLAMPALAQVPIMEIQKPRGITVGLRGGTGPSYIFVDKKPRSSSFAQSPFNMFELGIYGKKPLSKDFSLGAELLYQRLGSNDTESFGRPDIGTGLGIERRETERTLNALSLPVYATYDISPFSVNLGVQMTYNFGGEESWTSIIGEEGIETSVVSETVDLESAFSAGLMLGVGFCNCGEREFIIEFRYHEGLTDFLDVGASKLRYGSLSLRIPIKDDIGLKKDK
jgi:hypothetical protein